MGRSWLLGGTTGKARGWGAIWVSNFAGGTAGEGGLEGKWGPNSGRRRAKAQENHRLRCLIFIILDSGMQPR